MTDQGADKAFESWVKKEFEWADPTDLDVSPRFAFEAGRSSRDAEVERLRKALAACLELFERTPQGQFIGQQHARMIREAMFPGGRP